MALTRCPDCARDISAEAQACPHCGAPLRYDWRLRSGCAGCSVVLAAIVVLILLFGVTPALPR